MPSVLTQLSSLSLKRVILFFHSCCCKANSPAKLTSSTPLKYVITITFFGYDNMQEPGVNKNDEPLLTFYGGVLVLNLYFPVDREGVSS